MQGITSVKYILVIAARHVRNTFFFLNSAIVMSFPVCSILMIACNFIMVLALGITNFACRPFDNIIYNGAPVRDVLLLDDVSWFGFRSVMQLFGVPRSHL